MATAPGKRLAGLSVLRAWAQLAEAVHAGGRQRLTPQGETPFCARPPRGASARASLAPEGVQASALSGRLRSGSARAVETTAGPFQSVSGQGEDVS